MEQRLLCAAAAAARAQAFVRAPLPDDRLLEPPHPAFVGFRRMTYVWTEGNTMQPIGDRIRLWLEFLQAQTVDRAWLAVRGGETLVVTRGGGTAAWQVFEDEGIMTMRGGPAPASPPPDADLMGAGGALRDAIREAIGGEGGLRREELERGLAILGSTDDGSEVSDVAWPYFVLPEPAYGAAERRLLAAAGAAWPLPAAVEGLMAAVNSLESGGMRGAAPPHVK